MCKGICKKFIGFLYFDPVNLKNNCQKNSIETTSDKH